MVIRLSVYITTEVHNLWCYGVYGMLIMNQSVYSVFIKVINFVTLDYKLYGHIYNN